MSKARTRPFEFAHQHNLDVVALLTLLHWGALSLGVVERFFQGWFWRPTDKPAGSTLTILSILALFLLSGWVATRSWRRPARAVGTLVLCGFGIQMTLAHTEGRGLDGIRDRMVTTGHAEFIQVAAREPSIWNVLTQYERMVDSKRLGEFAPSKPPGQLVLYMVSHRAANLLRATSSDQESAERTRTFASVTWPLLSYLVLFPIFHLVSVLQDRRRALVACALYVCVPSVDLITLHTDQVFFPLFFVLPILLAVLAFSRRSTWLAVLTGLAWYVAAFLSFPLAAAAGFGVAVTLPFAKSHEGRKRFVRIWGVAASSAIVVGSVVWLLLDYDIVERYRGAVEYHALWKDWEHDAVSTFYYGALDLGEFALWLGIPITVLMVWRIRRSVMEAIGGRIDPTTMLAFALSIFFVGLVLFGKTKGEVARLWLFLVPVVCILAADVLHRRFADRVRPVLAIVIALQGITVYLTKRFQDFG